MKSIRIASFALGALCLLALGVVSQTRAQEPVHVYQYRKYYAMPGKLDDLKKRFRDHTIEIFARHHMRSVGYWEPADNKDNALVYILEHPSQADGERNWKEFAADPEWQAVAKASEANGKLVDHIENVYLRPTDFSPMK